MTPPAEKGNLAEILLAQGKPDDPALLFDGEQLNYDALRAATSAWSDWLQSQHDSLGPRIGLFAQNSPFFVAAYLGTIHAGLCSVPIPVDCSEKTFNRIVASCGIKTILVSERLQPRIQAWAEPLGLQLVSQVAAQGRAGQGGGSLAPPVRVDLQRHLAAIMCTSGSTGEVKGVMVTHQNILANTRDIVASLRLGPDDRMMTVLPFYYCYGTSLLHTHLIVGGSLVLNNRFMFPEKVLDEMQRTACTGLAGVPATYQILLRKTRFAQRQFPALRLLQQAGGKLPNPLIREIRLAFPNLQFFVMYGQTEATARLSILPPDRLDDKLGSIGQGLPHAKLEVLRPDGSHVAPGSDEIGEIVASGANIAAGYWADPEETARYFKNGKLHTGDMARLDADGFIFIVERARDFIKAMGYRISPKEIEEVLAEMPEVVESAVIGVPDELWGEAVKAFIAAVRPGQLSEDAVRSHCLNRLPNYKIPQHIVFVPSLPKLSSGKIDKESLRRTPPP